MSEQNNIESSVRNLALPVVFNEENRQQRRDNVEQQSSTDGWKKRQTIPGLFLPPADESLPLVFRQALQLVLRSNRISEENKTLVSKLLFGDEPIRLQYIASVYSSEIVDELKQMEDLKRQNELEAVMVVGSVDPNPNGPLGQLLSMLGGLKFPESISIALGKISSLKELARYLAQTAARQGRKDQALGYADALRQSPGSVSISGTDSDEISFEEVTSISNNEIDGLISFQDEDDNGFVRDTLDIADQRIGKSNKKKKNTQELITLNETISGTQNSDLRVRLENRRTDLRENLDDDPHDIIATA